MKKKFFKIAILIMLLVITYATIVNALSLTVAMEVNNTTVPEKTEFIVKVKVANLDVGQNGITSINAILKYDEDVFEPISESSLEGINGWTAKYATDTKKITLTKQTFVKTEEDVFNITLKTKEGTSGKEGIVELKEIKALNSDTEIPVTDVSVTINVGEGGGNTANTSNTGNVQSLVASSNKTNSTNNTNNTSNKTNTNNTASFVNNTGTTNSVIPQTGVEDSIVFLIAGVVLVAIVVFIQIERINKEMKK